MPDQHTNNTRLDQMTYLPKAAYVAFNVAGNTSVCARDSLNHKVSRLGSLIIPKCGGGFQMRLLCDVNAQPPGFEKYMRASQSLTHNQTTRSSCCPLAESSFVRVSYLPSVASAHVANHQI
jgi:hypothetical protein